ncbi:uncharacterized protein LOC132063214 isoform X1 [Lycium ferocissimum]|uniref:uncharacterized protein LOC132063214 isoform X1 n=1 Tax=Lycium ferocissimum TaxID=112874 RepID=UPI0028165BD6|nr:uncharacterized protein LOC132063214 isoform X1 [Lycium ferocissimum]
MFMRDVSACNTYNYGDALYWDARYVQEAGSGSFDWYQRYSALRPFVRHYVPTSSRVLMVGCGNAVMSEDMVKDGYEEIVNVDISTVAIDMMRRKYEDVPQLKYLEMDVRDMSFFPDESFDAVIDKGTLDSLMCGTNAPICAAQMLGEVSRLLKNGGVYMLITYGDPTSRMSHLNRPVFNWKIELYIIPRPGFQKHGDPPSNVKSCLEPIPLTEKGLLPADYVMEDPDSHFIYICKKMDESVELSNKSVDLLTADLQGIALGL